MSPFRSPDLASKSEHPPTHTLRNYATTTMVILFRFQIRGTLFCLAAWSSNKYQVSGTCSCICIYLFPTPTYALIKSLPYFFSSALPSVTQIRGSHSGCSSPLTTTVRAVNHISGRKQHLRRCLCLRLASFR